MRWTWVLLFAVMAWPAGCAAPSGPGPNVPSSILKVEPWTDRDITGKAVVSRHYVIYTTLNDRKEFEALSAVMEAALQRYRDLVPEALISERPMECYLFADRGEWMNFTRAKTGDDASIYLRITRGGYTVRDWYVAYYIGEMATLSVAAHEGFHQFAARNFKTRVPPFLEEGLACMFEPVKWVDGVPTWNLERNENRLNSLRTADAGGRLRPLRELVAMHAGQIVNRPVLQVSAFYAQSWAFATFLWAGQGGIYRPALQRLLSDAAMGKLEGAARRDAGGIFWTPSSAGPVLEHYLSTDLGTLDQQFRSYVRQRIADQGVDG